MATIDLRQSTFETLKTLAERRGSDLDALVEVALDQFIATQELSDDEYEARWDAVLEEIRAGVPKGLSAEEIEADIDEAIREVRAERRARSN